MTKEQYETGRLRDADRAVSRMKGMIYALKDLVGLCSVQLGDLSVDIETDFLGKDCEYLESVEKELGKIEERLSNAHK